MMCKLFNLSANRSVFIKLIIFIKLLLVFGKNVLLLPSQQTKIIGGELMNIENIPYLTSLQHKGKHICGGALISKHWILTAAHCSASLILTPGQLKVRVNSNYTNTGGQLLDIRRIVPHIFYNIFNIDYDFALIQLKLPLLIKEYAKLPNATGQLPDDSLVLISGWGETSNQNLTTTNETLFSVYVPKINHTVCQKIYGRTRFTSRMFCAGYIGVGGKDSCQGDSGGPAIVNGTVYGVVSWGFGCATPEYPGVYSNVVAVRNWIKLFTKF